MKDVINLGSNALGSVFYSFGVCLYCVLLPHWLDLFTIYQYVILHPYINEPYRIWLFSLYLGM